MAKSKKGTKLCTQKNRLSSLNIPSGFIKKNSKVQSYYKTPRSTHEVKIEDLPVEMMLKIFSHLSLEDLYKNVRSVCCRWWSIASSPCLWTTIKVGPNISTNELSNWLDMAPKLKNLEMHSRRDAGIVLSKISKCNKEIEYLDVYNCWGSEKNRNLPSLPLCHILTRCPYLTRICLRGSKFISCKFFELLFTRDELMSKKKLKRKRKNKSLEFFGEFTIKQLRAYLSAKLQARVRKIATLTNGKTKFLLFSAFQLLSDSNMAESGSDIERIIDSIFL